jgi:hypothetical protein
MNVNSSVPHQVSPSRTVAQGLLPWVPIALAAVSVSALLKYHFNQLEFTPNGALQHTYAWIYQTFGLAPSFLFCLLVLMWSTLWLLTGELQKPGIKLLRITAMAVLVGTFLNLGDGRVSPGLHKGTLGAWLAEGLYDWFGYVPSLVLVFGMTFASMLLATDFFFSDGFERLRQRRPGVASDEGVEAAVTDRLRSIAVPPVAEVVDAAASAPVVPAPLAIEVDDVPPPMVEPEPVDDVPRRRPSYFERRRERFAADEDWVPPAPESTEIDNPESRDLEDAAAARAMADEPRGEVQDAWVAAESLLRERGPDVAAESGTEPSRMERPGEPAAAPPARPLSDFGETFLDEREPDAMPQRWAQAIDLGGPELAPEAAASDAEGAAIEPAATTESVDDAYLPPAPEEAGAEVVVEPLADDEPLVPIPRPEATPAAVAPAVEPEPVLVPMPEPLPEPLKQQSLFGSELDEALVVEAIDLVTEARRASVAFLQRKLRIDYDLATRLLQELAVRGVVGAEGGNPQGRERG